MDNQFDRTLLENIHCDKGGLYSCYQESSSWGFRKNGTRFPELAEHDFGKNGTAISDKTERLSVY